MKGRSGKRTSSRASSSRWAPTGASCASRTSAASSSRAQLRRAGYADRFSAVIVIVDQQPGSMPYRPPRAWDAMADMAKTFPKGLEYRITYNPTEFVEVSIKKLYGTII
jgi:hypothetical protein